MKVVFKINAGQQLKLLALAAVSVQEAQKDEEFYSHKLVMCGDFAVSNTGFGVARQNLTIGDGYLTYEGTRTALQNGCVDALSVIVQVFGSIEAASTKVVSVESSVTYLKWHETEADALNRCPNGRLVELATKNNQVGYDAKVKLQKSFGDMLKMSPQKLSAQFTASELKEFNEARKALW